MGDEEFYEAAVRHWIDGTILEQQEEYDKDRKSTRLNSSH